MINQYCAYSFARNWQLPFLNQRKEENDHRKYFMINLHERMLLTSVGVKPATSWSPVGRASNWATEAGTGYNRIHQQTQTAPIRLHGPSLFASGIRALFSNFKRGWVCGGNLPHTKSENDYRFLRKGSDQICKLLLFLLFWWKTRSVNKQCLLDIRDPLPTTTFR